MAGRETKVEHAEEKREPRTIVCIPAYNEERTIAKVVIGAQNHASDVIVCDDGSEDMTGIIAERLGAKLVRHERNLGKGEAMRSLFLAARDAEGEVVVTIDGDGQHYTNEIQRLVAPILDGSADVVVGSRFLDAAKRIPSYRRAGNRVLNVLTAGDITDTQSGFRAYSPKAVRAILPSEMGMGVDSEILIEALNLRLRVAEVPVSVSYGEGRTSKHNPFFHTLDVIFSILKLTSIRHPLIFYGLPGFALVLGGVYYAIHTLQVFQSQGTITEVTLTSGVVSLGLLLLGLLMLFTGIILFSLVTVVRKKD